MPGTPPSARQPASQSVSQTTTTTSRPGELGGFGGLAARLSGPAQLLPDSAATTCPPVTWTTTTTAARHRSVGGPVHFSPSSAFLFSHRVSSARPWPSCPEPNKARHDHWRAAYGGHTALALSAIAPASSSFSRGRRANFLFSSSSQCQSSAVLLASSSSSFDPADVHARRSTGVWLTMCPVGLSLSVSHIEMSVSLALSSSKRSEKQSK